jgi:hypothetical protein
MNRFVQWPTRLTRPRRFRPAAPRLLFRRAWERPSWRRETPAGRMRSAGRRGTTRPPGPRGRSRRTTQPCAAGDECAGGQIAHQRLVDRLVLEGEVVDVLCQRQPGDHEKAAAEPNGRRVDLDRFNPPASLVRARRQSSRSPTTLLPFLDGARYGTNAPGAVVPETSCERVSSTQAAFRDGQL